MEVLSKVKKVEDSNFFNQHLSNVMIEDVSEVLSTVVKKEDGDFFNQSLSSAYIEDVDLDSSMNTISKEEDGDFFNQNLSSAYIEDVDLDSSMNTISKEEDGDFFNQNLSSAYIEDVDLDAVFNTIEKVETYKYNSEIDDMVSSGADTFKIVLTVTEPGNGNTAHLATGSFENLEYDTCLSPRSATALTEDVVFTDGEHSYNCTISVSSRWNDNRRDDYAPHNLFAPSGKRVSGWQGINASTSAILICTIQFTDYILASLLDNLTVYAGWNSSGYNDRYVKYVKYELYNSNDELLYEETKENLTNSGDYAMTFSHGLSSSSSDDKYYKMVITKTGNGTDSWGTTLAHGVFENLTYTGRKTQNYTSNITSVDVYFADESENVIECTCSYLSGRWSDNGKRYYAPCDFFATSQEQAWDTESATPPLYSEIMSNNKNSDLIVEFSFKTKMPLENLNNLTFDNGRYYASDVNVKVYSSDDLETYTEIIDMDLASGSSYTFTFDPSTI